MSMTVRSLLVSSAIWLAALALPVATPAQEGSRPSPKTEIKVTVGRAADDDGERPDWLVGGSFRYYASPRISVEPEVLYLTNGPGDHHLLVAPTVSADFRDPKNSVVPFGTAGGGFVYSYRRSKVRDPKRQDEYESSHAIVPTMNLGVGLKFYFGDRFFVAPELRLGVAPFARLQVSAGYVVSERRR